MTKDIFKSDEFLEKTKKLDLVAGRRAFIQAMGVGTIGAAVFASAVGKPIPAMAQSAQMDIDILNFALNLEYLESAFYYYAFHGTDIPAGNTAGVGGPGGTVVGGQKAALSSGLVIAYAQELATEELKHVQVLRKFLGASAVARPNLNIGHAFQTVAAAAGVPNGASFNAYAGDGSFLLASYIFEDVGVTAYHGAAGLLQSKAYLNYAAGILAVEAYHAGIIRTALFALENDTAINNTQLIANLRSKLANNGTAGVDDVGIGTFKAPQLVDVDAPNATTFNDLPGGDAIAYARTTTQVLDIVYGSPNKTPGVFFPNGMNGNIK